MMMVCSSWQRRPRCISRPACHFDLPRPLRLLTMPPKFGGRARGSFRDLCAEGHEPAGAAVDAEVGIAKVADTVADRGLEAGTAERELRRGVPARRATGVLDEQPRLGAGGEP